GPAYDAPELLGEGEYGITRYPNEAWEDYLARVQRAWTTAPTRGVNIVDELAAAGYPGAVLRYHGDMPDLDTADYWSEFWVWFPYGTHSVVSDETQVVQTETGGFISYDVEGLSLADVRTMRSIIAANKPGHWICRSVLFEWTPEIND